MKLTDFSFVCDENIHPVVVDFLKEHLNAVKTVAELNLTSADDERILETAHATQSIVLTHDSDFGKIVFMKKVAFTGIVYLRPGHIVPLLTMDTLKTLFANEFELDAPFMLVAERTMVDTLKVRIRHLG